MSCNHITRRHALKTSLATGLMLSSGLQAHAQGSTREVLEMSKGSDDAPVTVVEYASFTCPHCARFHLDVFPQVRANFIDEGKVKFVMREVYFDRFGLWAGMIARCAGPDRYFGVVDLLFERQSEWLSGGDPTAVVDSLKAIGRQAGMVNDEMDACLEDQQFAKALVESYQTNATADEISGTPSFIVNGTKQSNMGYQQFAAMLNAELDS